MFARFLFLSPLFLSLTTTAVSTENLLSNCWDGTFGYKVATLFVNDNLVEIGLTGSFGFINESSGLIGDASGIPITNPGAGNSTMFLTFSRSECQETNGDWACKATASDSSWGFGKKLFVGRAFRSISGDTYLISPARVSEIEVKFNSNRVETIITGRKFSNEEAPKATINFGFRHCSVDGRMGNTFYGNALFPQSLKDYLEETNHQ